MGERKTIEEQKIEFPTTLSAALKKWKLKGTEAEGAYELDRAINFAKFDGIDLILKVPRSALGKEAFEFAAEPKDADPVSFYIPSKLGRSGEVSDKIPEIVEQTDYHHMSHLLIRTSKAGVCATLSPDQVTDLKPK